LQRTSKKTFNLNPTQLAHKIYNVSSNIKTLKAKAKYLYKIRNELENDLPRIRKKKLAKDLFWTRKKTCKRHVQD
jgi:hypothetical protein